MPLVSRTRPRAVPRQHRVADERLRASDGRAGTPPHLPAGVRRRRRDARDGSSAAAVGAGDIVVYDPGVVTDTDAEPLPPVTTGVNGFRCSDQRAGSGIAAQGRITTRAQELAGAQAVSGGGNPTGYVPCSYAAPVSGVYGVAFYGPSGAGADVDGGVTGETGLASAANFDASQATSVAAWDVTVRVGRDLDDRPHRPPLHQGTRRLHGRQRAADQPQRPCRDVGRLPLPHGRPRPRPERVRVLRQSVRVPGRGRGEPALPRRVRDDEHRPTDGAGRRRHVRGAGVPDLPRRRRSRDPDSARDPVDGDCARRSARCPSPAT